MTVSTGKLHTLPLETRNIDAETAVEKLFEPGGETILMNGVSNGAAAQRIRELGKASRRVFTQVGIVRFQDRTILVTDGYVFPQPDLKEMTMIIQNAVGVAARFQITEPKVAVLSAFEVVSPAMGSAVPAAVMEAMGKRRQFGPSVNVEGPLSMDVALSSKAAEEKHVSTPVAGHADVLVGHMSTVPAGILSAWGRFARPTSLISILTDGESCHPFLTSWMTHDHVRQTLVFCKLL